MDYDEYTILGELINTTESLEFELEQSNLTFLQAEKRTNALIAQFKNLCHTYTLPLDNKAIFCQALYQMIDKGDHEEILWLYTALLSDKGLLFDTNRTDRTTEQNTSRYLTMQRDMSLLRDELDRQSSHYNAFYELQQQLKIRNTTMMNHGNETDRHFIFQSFRTYFPIPSSCDTNILMDNITLMCAMLANRKELMAIAPLFIYQIVSRHKSRLCSAENFQFNFSKLWVKKNYQIEKDNGKNFENMIALLNFFLELCSHFSKNFAVNIELSLYIFCNLSNLCEWYHTNFQHDEKIYLPVPMKVMIARCRIDCCGDGIDYGCNDEEFVDFFNSKKSYTKQIEQYLTAHPEIIQQYIDNLSGSSDKRRHLVYQILDNIELPPKSILTDNFPLIYAIINIFLDIAVNQQVDELLLKIGQHLIN